MAPETQAFITTIIAVYGALIASISLVLSIVLGITELRRRQPRVRVRISMGHFFDLGNKRSEPLILVDAVNTGYGSVVLNTFGFLLQDGAELIIVNPYMIQLPHTLQERRRLIAYFACRSFRENKDKDKISAAFFRDETGDVWKAKLTKKLRKKILESPSKGYKIN